MAIKMVWLCVLFQGTCHKVAMGYWLKKKKKTAAASITKNNVNELHLQ